MFYATLSLCMIVSRRSCTVWFCSHVTVDVALDSACRSSQIARWSCLKSWVVVVAVSYPVAWITPSRYILLYANARIFLPFLPSRPNGNVSGDQLIINLYVEFMRKATLGTTSLHYHIISHIRNNNLLYFYSYRTPKENTINRTHTF
jgi:hypothetical protein